MIEIVDLPDGQTVPGPGAYRMSMDLYHSQKVCPGPSISSSGLRTISTQSAHAFWKTSAWNPNPYPPKEPNEGMILGRAAHALLLGDEVFDEHFAYVPGDAPPRPTKPQIAAFETNGFWSESARPRAEWWKAFDERAAGKMLLREEVAQRIAYMAENLRQCPEAVEALTGMLTEISLIWQDEATGLWLKARPDCLPTIGPDAGDLKTFAPKGADLVLAAHRACTDRGYPQQMALIAEAVEKVFGNFVERCALVFVQTTEPYEVVPIMLDAEAMYWARVLNRQAMEAAAHGLATGEWPMRAQTFVTYSYPPSMLHRFGEQQLNGDLPNLERNAA